MRHQRILTNERQRAAMREIARLLSELGRCIHPVSRRSRRHSLDFIAVPRFGYSNFILVQLEADGSILVRTYTTVALSNLLRAALEHRNWGVPIRVSDRLLRKPYGKTQWWRLYFPCQVVKREYPTMLSA